MKLRVFALAGLLSLGLMALVPSTIAQNQARVDVWMEWDIEHEHHLGETGRDIMKGKVVVRAQNFTCVNQDTTKTTIKIRGDMNSFDPPFPKVFGASMKPAFFSVEFPNQSPGLTQPATKEDTAPTLDIAWNVEDRPKKDAKFTYVVRITNPRLDATWGSPSCAPTPSFFEGRSKGMTVYMDDVVENVNGTCDVSTDPDKCLAAPSTTAPPPAEAPLLNATILIGSIMALAIVMRRRRNA